MWKLFYIVWLVLFLFVPTPAPAMTTEVIVMATCVHHFDPDWTGADGCDVHRDETYQTSAECQYIADVINNDQKPKRHMTITVKCFKAAVPIIPPVFINPVNVALAPTIDVQKDQKENLKETPKETQKEKESDTEIFQRKLMELGRKRLLEK